MISGLRHEMKLHLELPAPVDVGVESFKFGDLENESVTVGMFRSYAAQNRTYCL